LIAPRRTSPPPIETELSAPRARFGQNPTVSILEKLLRSKLVVWLLIVIPGLWPAWPFFVKKDPSALTDPLKFVLLHFGFVACLLVAIVLTFSPLRTLFPKWGVAQAVNRHRRLVGVSAFAYALLHFTVHVYYQYDGTYEGTITQLGKELQKPFQLTGLVALTILLVLAVTSFKAAVRWLGGRKWKNLHRFIYLAAALIAYHQAAAKKIFPMQVVWIFGPLAVLEIARIVKQRAKARAAPKPIG
jgi:sulfoxide reductase heme-binding subunit YedZ